MNEGAVVQVKVTFSHNPPPHKSSLVEIKPPHPPCLDRMCLRQWDGMEGNNSYAATVRGAEVEERKGKYHGRGAGVLLAWSHLRYWSEAGCVLNSWEEVRMFGWLILSISHEKIVFDKIFSL